LRTTDCALSTGSRAETVIKEVVRRGYDIFILQHIFYTSVLVMDMKNVDPKLVEEAHVLLHPIRFRIVELLAERPMHINEIAKAMEEERRLVSYHLLTLEEYGFVSSKYEISEHPKSRGKAIRKYWVNGKMEDVISELKKKL
jgi:DNA-binding transcriptional ArsR family regulator